MVFHVHTPLFVQMYSWEHMYLSVHFYTLANCFQWEIVPLLAVGTEVLEDDILHQARTSLWDAHVYFVGLF